MAWPPELADLKLDMRVADDRDDAQLQVTLDAAVAHVERMHAGTFNFAEDPTSALADVPADLVLGTLRLAGRWHTRRRSPDGLIAAGDLGTSRVPAVDADIERLLRVGRFRGPVVA